MKGKCIDAVVSTLCAKIDELTLERDSALKERDYWKNQTHKLENSDKSYNQLGMLLNCDEDIENEP